MRILRRARGKTRLDIRNGDITKEAHVKPVETFPEIKGLKWFGHCLRLENNHICVKLLRLKFSERRSRGRPKMRWRDNIQGDMKKYQLTEDMAQDRKYWMTKIMDAPKQGDGQDVTGTTSFDLCAVSEPLHPRHLICLSMLSCKRVPTLLGRYLC